MGVEVKIQPYRKNKDNAFNEIQILNFEIVPQGSTLNRRFYTQTPYNELQIQQIIILYGLQGRFLHTENSDGNPTKAILTGNYIVREGFVFVNHYDWDNQLPDYGADATTTSYQKDDWRHLIYGDQLDISEDILEDDITIDYKLETNRIFELESSFGTITIDESDAVKDFFDNYWRSVTTEDDFEIVFGIEIFKDGESEAWMASQRSDITYDPINYNYTLKCYDWVRMQLEQIGGQQTPLISYPSVNVPVSFYLEQVFDKFKQPGIATVVDVGDMSNTFNRTEYRTRSFMVYGETYYTSPEENMTVNGFITELQKHYAAFLYYDKNRILRFRRRDYLGDEINIDDLIREETFEETIRLRDYTALVVDFNSTAGIVTYDGWYIIVADPDDPNNLNITGVTEEEINEREDLFDLRQSLPYPIYGTAVFEYRGVDKRYDDYKEFLTELRTFRCTVDSLDIDLFTKVIYNGTEYRVISVSKNYTTEDSEIEFVKMI